MPRARPGGGRALIGHTQPRRVAARTIAERIAEELGSELGGAVGYTVRFTDRSATRRMVKVMTDGILLAEIQRDRDLRRYDTLIIDEAHERSLNIDFLLGYLHQLLPRRPDLKLVVTSATIDTERFAAHFGGAPIATVVGPQPSGRDPLPPVRDRTGRRPRPGAGDRRRGSTSCSGRSTATSSCSSPASARSTTPPTPSAGSNCADTEVLPLYARLSSAEQQRIFQPARDGGSCLSTNVAETSLTVPGVRTVIDAGAARISRYNRRLKVQRLPIEPISQASANQRAGRCGRVAPGICIRLYDEDEFLARPEFTEPEILRTNLASVILQMTALGLGDVSALPLRRTARRAGDRRRGRPARGARRVRPGHRRPVAPADAHSASGWPDCRSTPGSAGWCSKPSGSAAPARC